MAWLVRPQISGSVALWQFVCLSVGGGCSLDSTPNPAPQRLDAGASFANRDSQVIGTDLLGQSGGLRHAGDDAVSRAWAQSAVAVAGAGGAAAGGSAGQAGVASSEAVDVAGNGVQPMAAGSAAQPTAAGSAAQPMAAGSAAQPTAAGSAAQPTAAGRAAAGVQPTAAGAGAQASTAGSSLPPTAAGASAPGAAGRAAPSAGASVSPEAGGGSVSALDQLVAVLMRKAAPEPAELAGMFDTLSESGECDDDAQEKCAVVCSLVGSDCAVCAAERDCSRAVKRICGKAAGCKGKPKNDDDAQD